MRIRAIILRSDYTVKQKKIKSNDSHFHEGGKSFIHLDHAVKTKEEYPNDPIEIYQEGIAAPKGTIGGIGSRLWWITWYIPMFRGLLKKPHRRGGWSWWYAVALLLPIAIAIGYYLYPHLIHHVIENVKDNIPIYENGIIITGG